MHVHHTVYSTRSYYPVHLMFIYYDKMLSFAWIKHVLYIIIYVQVSVAKFECTSVDSMCTIIIQYCIVGIFMGENFLQTHVCDCNSTCTIMLVQKYCPMSKITLCGVQYCGVIT